MEVTIRGPVGRLFGVLEEPEDTSRLSGAAICCHPHPLHGGTHQNTIVYRLARALRSAGLATLRFDFRGVGSSEGAHDGHGGEEGDASAALDLLQERYPGLPLWATGFSFGSRTVGSLATRDFRIERLALIALPVSIYASSFLDELSQPTLMVFGSGDTFGTLTELAQRHPSLGENFELEEISGADHFFRGRTPLLEETIRNWAQAATGRKLELGADPRRPSTRETREQRES
jgi:alpha/beta superfamily hydrolase